MQIHNLRARKLKSKKRVGRGGKSGTYSGRGMKGQKARSGYSRRATWEGGRTTLIAATKKNRGFKSRNIKSQVLNLNILDKKFKDGDKITAKSLFEAGVVKKMVVPIKILGVGKITKKFTITEILVSDVARKKIEEVGGKII